MEIVRPLDDRRRLQELLTGLGILYAEQGEFDKMSDCLDRSLKIAKELGDQTGVATILVDLGIAEREQGHVDKALQNLIQSLTMAEQIKSTGLGACQRL
jgi:tetratricopeptide (TPR) repeat protein